MIRQEEIALVINSQRDVFLKQESGFKRDALDHIPVAESFATIITGIRRCGKSTLLLQLLRKDYQDALYLNFDDIRFSAFETGDFVRVHREIEKRGIQVLFFDEIQVIKNWETFVNQLLRERYKIFVTGSNAAMLSVELGTHLTGRHLSMELFPFSYSEYINYKNCPGSVTAVEAYIKTGGIPEFIKSALPEVIYTLVDDILVRDIAIRHAVRDINSLRQLAAYLISNIGNLISANKLVGMFEIKSATTFLEYFSFLKDAYLLDFIPLFNHSLKVQARNPKKVYVMDLGIYSEVSVSTSDNMGRRLENLVFLELRRKYKELYYYKNKGECDFVTMERGQLKEAIQVCLNVSEENFDRELFGVLEAMQDLKISTGYIVTLNQSDILEKDGLTVKMIPAHEFFDAIL
jgi:predicted AAA+ superfamily ATPase